MCPKPRLPTYFCRKFETRNSKLETSSKFEITTFAENQMIRVVNFEFASTSLRAAACPLWGIHLEAGLESQFRAPSFEFLSLQQVRLLLMVGFRCRLLYKMER